MGRDGGRNPAIPVVTRTFLHLLAGNRSGTASGEEQHQQNDDQGHRDYDLPVPGILFSVYALPFFPFRHCYCPFLGLSLAYVLNAYFFELTSPDYTYISANELSTNTP